MKRICRSRLAHALAALTLLSNASLPVNAGFKVKYARTELDKAVGGCVVSVLIGGLGGALLAGKRNRSRGAVIGAAAGGAVCAVLIANAKRKDRIIAAQRETASRGTEYTTSFADNEGGNIDYLGTVGQPRQIDSQYLLPVRYEAVGGGKVSSPVLESGGAECRDVNSSLYGSGGTSRLPAQLVCRTPNGDWQPYGQAKA